MFRGCQGASDRAAPFLRQKNTFLSVDMPFSSPTPAQTVEAQLQIYARFGVDLGPRSHCALTPVARGIRTTESRPFTLPEPTAKDLSAPIYRQS